MNDLYKGYIETKGKQAIEKFKGRSHFKSLQEAQELNGYAGVLADDTILIDIDDGEQSEILMNIVDDLQLNCRVYRTTRGRHFLFKNGNGGVKRNRTHITLAVGITADIKLGSRTSYEVIKINGEERFCEYDIEEDEQYQEVPKWLWPVNTSVDFLDMVEGDGRNDALYSYILRLTNAGLSVDDCREAIRLLNKWVFKKPLADSELEVILRDEAFAKPVFFEDGTFLFEKLAEYLRDDGHIVHINGQLHIYSDGTYQNDPHSVEEKMISLIPHLRKSQRKETMDYLDLICDKVKPSDARYLAFANGILDIITGEFTSLSSEYVITNRVPWNYVPDAYNELTDKTLNKLACQDGATRQLLEECIGYCLYRRNELGKAFILTGEKSNGKSTFLDMIKTMLGEDNISALDLKELGDRFSTSMMFGKLANIGDDIGDEFLQGSQVAIFKKVVTGNRIKAERKGQDPFEFEPYIKLLFSANDIPRMKDKTGAVLRRLVIIPFNATFSKLDPDYDPYIKYKLVEQSSMEYLIQLAIQGLRRVLENQEFTSTDGSEKAIAEYEEENNPVVGFIRTVGKEAIVNESTSEVFRRYQVYCADNGYMAGSNITFSKSVNRLLNLEVKQRKINGKPIKIFTVVTVSNG